MTNRYQFTIEELRQNSGFSEELAVDYVEGQEENSNFEEQINNNAENITQNANDIAQNTLDITQNTNDIATNAANIATNATNIATNSSDIADLQAGVDGDSQTLAQHDAQISQNTSTLIKSTKDIDDVLQLISENHSLRVQVSQLLKCKYEHENLISMNSTEINSLQTLLFDLQKRFLALQDQVNSL